MVSYIRTYPQEYYYNNPITCPSSELSLPPSTSIFMKQSQVVPTAGPTPEINSPGASPADGSLEHFEALIGTTLGGPVKMSVNVPCNENCKLVNRRRGKPVEPLSQRLDECFGRGGGAGISEVVRLQWRALHQRYCAEH